MSTSNFEQGLSIKLHVLLLGVFILWKQLW